MQYGDATVDMRFLAPRFARFPPEIRDLLFAEYVEEISAQVVGEGNLIEFFTRCFNGQGYRVTDASTPEHNMWIYRSEYDTHDEL